MDKLKEATVSKNTWVHSCIRYCIQREHLSYFYLEQSSCCVGGLAKPQSLPERTPMASKKINIGHFSAHKESQWSSSPEAMENNISISHSLETNFSLAPNAANEIMMLPEENHNNLFTNQAAIAWNEMRREWVGDQSKRSHMAPREPTISWSTTYEDLVSTTQPFPRPIPLSEMVDFLVDVWHEEGLYD